MSVRRPVSVDDFAEKLEAVCARLDRIEAALGLTAEHGRNDTRAPIEARHPGLEAALARLKRAIDREAGAEPSA